MSFLSIRLQSTRPLGRWQMNSPARKTDLTEGAMTKETFSLSTTTGTSQKKRLPRRDNYCVMTSGFSLLSQWLLDMIFAVSGQHLQHVLAVFAEQNFCDRTVEKFSNNQHGVYPVAIPLVPFQQAPPATGTDIFTVKTIETNPKNFVCWMPRQSDRKYDATKHQKATTVPCCCQSHTLGCLHVGYETRTILVFSVWNLQLSFLFSLSTVLVRLSRQQLTQGI